MGAAILLQLLTVCGLCCNKDRCLGRKKKNGDEPKFNDLPEQSGDNLNSNS